MTKKTTPKFDNIHQRLVAFHASFHGAKRSGTNPRFNSSYFTLDDLVEAVRKPLADVGLYVRHELVVSSDGMSGVKTGIPGLAKRSAPKWTVRRSGNSSLSQMN